MEYLTAFFISQNSLFFLRWQVIKRHFLKSAHKSFLFEADFKHTVLKINCKVSAFWEILTGGRSKITSAHLCMNDVDKINLL